MQNRIIGRKEEKATLEDCYNSEFSEFLAIYGRRRVGKTFLVNEYFEGNLAFCSTGISGGTRQEQIDNFNQEFANHGYADLASAKNWQEIFTNLNTLITRAPKDSKKVIFLDEVPWMDTQKSGFLGALDHFWNRWISARHDVLLIVCGSATSWIVDNLVNNYGGLHNRLTNQIFLKPFTLSECEQYFKHRNVAFKRFDILEAYMIFGGVPHYLSLIKPRLSLAQNIDKLYFAQNAPLKDEFWHLYRSLYKRADTHLAVVEALASKNKGLTRSEIATSTNTDESGTLTRILNDLINNGLIRRYHAFGKKKQDSLYQLVDPFSLFHLRFAQKREVYNESFWQQFRATGAHNAWSGYAFERVCLLHVEQIKRSLGISGVLTEVSSFKSKSYEPGAQIDLVLDRADGIINLCEAKYVKGEFAIDKTYDLILRNKEVAFETETKTHKGVNITMITTFGIKRNLYSGSYPFQVIADDLFV